LYATGESYPSIVPKWLLSDPGVFPGVSKNDRKIVEKLSREIVGHKKTAIFVEAQLLR
jgi:hypothetical protein